MKSMTINVQTLFYAQCDEETQNIMQNLDELSGKVISPTDLVLIILTINCLVEQKRVSSVETIKRVDGGYNFMIHYMGYESACTVISVEDMEVDANTSMMPDILGALSSAKLLKSMGAEVDNTVYEEGKEVNDGEE